MTIPSNPINLPWDDMASGYFTGGGGNPAECIVGCAQCSAGSTCDTCASGTVLLANNTCGRCQGNCKTCT